MFVTTVKELKRNTGKTISLNPQGHADTKYIEGHMTLLDEVDGLSLHLNGMDNKLYYVNSENKLYEVVAMKEKQSKSALNVVSSLVELDKQLDKGIVTFGDITPLESLTSVNSFMSTHLMLDAGKIEKRPQGELVTRTLFKNLSDVVELEVRYNREGSFLQALSSVVEKI